MKGLMKGLLISSLFSFLFGCYYHFKIINTPYIEKSNSIDKYVNKALEKSKHILIKKYPPLLFWSPYVQTLFFILKRELICRWKIQWTPEIFSLDDGQNVRLYWYHPESIKKSDSHPLILITGGAISERAKNPLIVELTKEWHNKGFRILVFERRGHSRDIPLILPKYSVSGSAEDLLQVYSYAIKKYNPSYTIAVGISAGVSPITLFLNKMIINNSKIASNMLCGIGIAPMYSTKGFSSMSSFCANIILYELKRMFRLSHKNLIDSNKLELKKVTEILEASNLDEFFVKTNNIVSENNKNYIPTLATYFKGGYKHIPMLLFNAEDDIISKIEYYCNQEETIKKRNNTLFYFSKNGGHGYFLDLKMNIDIIPKIIAFTDALKETKKH